jgi:hypothetical protein
MTTAPTTGSAPIEADRRLPAGDEVFLDHVGHFVPDRDAAIAALTRAGFAPTPISIQVTPDPAGGAPQPTGTGNVTVMLDRGYLEILFKTADTPLGREFDAMMARYRGVRLAAFAVADVAATHARLAAVGFGMQPLAAMQRPVKTEAGDDIAAFALARPVPGEMPEGRIQFLTHRTEHTVWQPRWLAQPNGATGLIDMVIADARPDEAARRFGRFLDRAPGRNRHGPMVARDRGRVQFVVPDAVPRLFDGITVPDLPFIAGYGLRVGSLAAATACLRAGGIAYGEHDRCVIAPFPDALGIGAWAFVERAADLPWRKA